MSSPLASASHSIFKKKLIAFHQTFSHSSRIALLSNKIASSFVKLQLSGDEIKILDIGCGDMKLLYSLKNNISVKSITGIDIYKLPDNLKQNIFWQPYQYFDGITIPYASKTFSVALLIDVLHHLPDEQRLNLVKEAGRVANYVIIKDHFEYGFFSRHMLRLMDFVGNWAYGVSVPNSYFSIARFKAFIIKTGLQKISMQQNIRLYDHNFIFRNILKSKWQFIYIGKSSE